jgi:hypothetical protein
MKFAKKINIEVDMPYLHKATVILGKHGKGLNDFDEGVIRRYLPKKQVEIVKDSLPEKIKNYVLGVNLTEVRLLAPHIHLVEKCVINFYQQTNGEITKFFEGDIEADNDWSIDNGNGYLNVKINKLTEVENFIAKDNDVWILDAGQPHSVEVINDLRKGMHKFEPNGNTHRKIVQVYMSIPFSEVINYFN